MAYKAYWKLNGDLNDSSGGGNTLTNVASVTFESNTADFGTGNTSKHLYRYSALGFVYGLNNITYSTRVKFKAFPTDTGILTGSALMHLQVSDASLFRVHYRLTLDSIDGVYKITFWNGAWTSVTVPVVLNKWYQFGYTNDISGNKKVYFNGDLIFSGTSTSDQGARSTYEVSMITLGAIRYNNLGSATYNFLNGNHDDSFYDNTVFTPAQIKNEYLRQEGFF